jgi:hypothetical protein
VEDVDEDVATEGSDSDLVEELNHSSGDGDDEVPPSN